MGINRDQKIVASFQQAAELNALYLLYELLWGWGWVGVGAPADGVTRWGKMCRFCCWGRPGDLE